MNIRNLPAIQEIFPNSESQNRDNTIDLGPLSKILINLLLLNISTIQIDIYVQGWILKLIIMEIEIIQIHI